MYDLTSTLTTISAAAASFVAILGGFIASKLLSISGERDTVRDELENLNNDLDFYQSENARLQAELNEDDALIFISNHLDDLMGFTSINECYPVNEQVGLSLEVLTPYWDKALGLIQELREALLQKETLNSDNIPNSIAKKYVKDDFSYSILRDTIKKLYPDNSFFAPISIPSISVGLGYRDKTNAIESNKIKIENCKYEMSRLQKRKKQLYAPKGMKLGLGIFVVFSLLCIVLPLCFCPFTTEDYKCYIACKIVFIAIFVIGLLSTFLYLIYLLKWKKASKSKQKGNRKTMSSK